MKKRILSLLLIVAIIMGVSSTLMFSANAVWSVGCSPYATVENAYSSDVKCGTVRYISQIKGSTYFYSAYWPSGAFGGYSSPGTECGTASISMALSYVGVNKTPKTILEKNNGYTYFTGWGPTTSSPSVSEGMTSFINGQGKYSPVIIHLPNYSSAGHWVVLVGQVSGNVYRVLDPANANMWDITVSGTSAKYTKNGTTINDTIDRTYQYYNADATIDNGSAEHTCNKGTFAGYEETHPHYSTYTCSICGNTWKDKTDRNNLSTCDACIEAIPYYISPGVYTIHSAWDYNNVLDIQDDSMENQANIHLDTYTGSDTQKFRVIECGDYYFIQSVYSGLWMDVASPVYDSGSNVQLYNSNELNEEKWMFEDAGSGYVYIRNYFGCFIDIGEDSNIQVYDTKLHDSQRWKLVPVEDPSYSQGVQNIVKRAYQMTNIQWTPLNDITGWKGGLTYKAGKTYTGIPYGQPVSAGDYVPWETGLAEFSEHVKNSNSKMYTSQASYNSNVAPYYSTDCSAFVSWAWQLPSRTTTSYISQYATKISSDSYDNMQVGDCLNKAGVHVVLVTDIEYDSAGTIVAVEISEATVNSATYYCCQKTWYGSGYSKSLTNFYDKYFGDGYILYRSKTRDDVTYTHECCVPLEGDVCSKCGVGEDHTCDRGSFAYYETVHPHYNWYTCSLCGEIWRDTSSTTPLSTCDACRPGKPVLTYSANSESCESAAITFAWNKTSNTTHYNLWLDKKTADGGWEKVENVFYAESGLVRTFAEGEYRAQLLSYNSNMWETDDSDWVHTWAENVYFTVGHDYELTIIPATCTEYALNLYTCSICGDNYSEYEDSIYSEWSTTYPQGIDASLIETKTQWRYSDYETKTTDSSNMTGWTLLKSDWDESETGTVDYVSSWPSGFSTGHSLYSTYHNVPKTATENSTTKIKPGSTSACGYIYWHWCRGDYTAGPINRKTSQTQTGEFDTFHAFYSTTAPSSLGTPASDGSYVYSNGSCCTDTYWYYPITVYRQNYTVYSKMYTYYRWTEWSEWSDKEYHESETRNVEERTVCRYISAPLGGHSWDNGTVTTPPTEEAEGVKTYTCTACGATKTESIPVLEHSHSYVATVTASTCTEQGYTTYTCTCGDSYKANYVDALGHDMVDVPGKDATCTENGYTSSAHCSRCDHAYAPSVLPATGHSWDNGAVTTPPTEEAEGVKTYTCTACGATKTEAIPVLDHSHSYAYQVVAPTCTEQGYTLYTCSCGDSFKENFVDALGHNATDWIVDLAPTCTVAGSMHTECTRCGALLQTSAIQPSGHTESDWIIDKEATCTEGGAKHKECTVCKLRLQTEGIPALGHNYASVVTEPTCTEAGYTTYTCEICGHSYTGDAVPATGHDYEDGSCTHCGAEDPDWTEPEEPFVNPFIDVKEKDFFYDPVLWAVQKGITNGTTPTTFSPYDPCTRGQIVTFLWRAFGSPDPTSTRNPFTDVPETVYYYKAILWAVEQGITTGTSATTFSPEDTCTRGQVATFLWRACDKPEPQASENPFTDVPETVYYYEPILWAVENGITNGTGNGKFSPEDSCTRGQIVTFLYRALAK